MTTKKKREKEDGSLEKYIKWTPTISDRQTIMSDISNPNNVEVTWGTTYSGIALWVNINGMCRVRIYGIKELRIQGKKIKGN